MSAVILALSLLFVNFCSAATLNQFYEPQLASGVGRPYSPISYQQPQQYPSSAAAYYANRGGYYYPGGGYNPYHYGAYPYYYSPAAVSPYQQHQPYFNGTILFIHYLIKSILIDF